MDGFAWHSHAACRGDDPERFFVTNEAEAELAKESCVGCAVRLECLAFALRSGERFGVWGGMSERERSLLTSSERDEILAAIGGAARHPSLPAA